MTLLKPVVVIIVGMLVLCVGVTAAQKNMGETVAQLWGSNITVREFLSQVSPELLQSIPRNAWETTVGWGSASVTAYKQADHLTELSRDEPDFITVKATNSFSVSGKTVTLGASNTVVDPLFYHVPAMSVYCFLLEDGLNIFTHGDYDTDVWRVTSRESYAVSGGAYYQNMSYHFVDYPVGYYPPTIFWIKYSSTRWINE